MLDANVFIEAKNRYYGFDFCPAFWDWLDRAHAAGTVFSIDKIHDELVGGNDELATWTQQRTSQFFLVPDATVHNSRPWALVVPAQVAGSSVFSRADS